MGFCSPLKHHLRSNIVFLLFSKHRRSKSKQGGGFKYVDYVQYLGKMFDTKI